MDRFTARLIRHRAGQTGFVVVPNFKKARTTPSPREFAKIALFVNDEPRVTFDLDSRSEWVGVAAGPAEAKFENQNGPVWSGSFTLRPGRVVVIDFDVPRGRGAPHADFSVTTFHRDYPPEARPPLPASSASRRRSIIRWGNWLLPIVGIGMIIAAVALAGSPKAAWSAIPVVLEGVVIFLWVQLGNIGRRWERQERESRHQ